MRDRKIGGRIPAAGMTSGKWMIDERIQVGQAMLMIRRSALTVAKGRGHLHILRDGVTGAGASRFAARGYGESPTTCRDGTGIT